MTGLNGAMPTLIQGSFAVAVLGLIYKIAIDNNKKVDTIFKRFDEYKESVKKDFVQKPVCDVVREQLGSDIKEIKADVKELIKIKRNGG